MIERLAAYLALSPAVFPHHGLHTARSGLPPGSRIVLERPFGDDLYSAVELKRLLAECVPERAAFRVDHFLAMTTVQNVLGSRLRDVLNGNAASSIRGDEAEEPWRVVAPMMSASSKDLVPLQEYPAGSEGPGAAVESSGY